MPELRWILLGLGVLFCLGLWLWESRRGRQAADSRGGLKPSQGFGSAPAARDGIRRPTTEAPILEREQPPWEDSADADEPGSVQDEQPLLPPAEQDYPQTIFLEEDEDRPPGPMIDIAAERRPLRPERIEPVIGDAAAAVGGTAASQSRSGRGAPLDPRGDSSDLRAPEYDRPSVDPGAGATPRNAPVAEKIVAVRVCAPPLERFEGRSLVTALRNAGLEHGKFSIFHRGTAAGDTLFSVASLVEPGTFDLDAVDGRRFPGVSFFTVLQDAATAGPTVEEMLSTARGLASELHGTLQDERGAPLSPQRLTDLRADVAAWARAHDSDAG